MNSEFSSSSETLQNLNSKFSSSESFQKLHKNASNASIDTMTVNQKHDTVHKRLIHIVGKKIEHYIGLDDYDLDYINYDCSVQEQNHFMEIYNNVVKNLKEIVKKHGGVFPKIVKQGSFYGIDKINGNDSD